MQNKQRDGYNLSLRRDSACSDKLAIAACVSRLRTLSARPYTPLQSPNFSSTILESQSSTEAQITKNAQSLESTFTQSPNSSSTISLESKAQNKQPAKTNQITPESKNLDSGFSPSLRGGGKATNEAIHKKIESTFAKLESMDCHATATALARNDRKIDSSQSSSRADKVGVAIQSNQSRTLSKVRNLESVQGVWGFKGDKGERFASSPPVPLEESLSQTKLESSESEKKSRIYGLPRNRYRPTAKPTPINPQSQKQS